MDTPIKRALAEAMARSGDSATKLARQLGPEVKRQNVEYWLKSGSVPMHFGAPLEVACGGVMRRWHMWPDVWHLIWPELIGAEGAPPLPTAQKERRDAAGRPLIDVNSQPNPQETKDAA